MGKLLKILGWTLGLAVIVLLAAVLILPQVIDPNDYKEEIVAKVKEATGRDLAIDGRIELSVFPWLGVETGAITMGNAKGFEEQSFAAIESAALRVKLLPLLSRKLEVDTIGLKGLKLNLTRLPDGSNNWDDLAGAGEREEPGADSGAAKEEPSGGLAGFSIGGIDISDARIVWDDRGTGQQVSVDRLRLNSGPVVAGKPVDLQLAMVLQNKAPAVDAKVDLKAVVALDEAAGVVNVSGLEILLDAAGDALPGGAVKAVLAAAISAALDGSRVDVTGLKLNAGELGVSGSLQGRDLKGQPAFSGNLDLAEFDLRQWMAAHAMVLPPMADPKTLTRVGVSLKLGAGSGLTRMDDLAVRLDDSRINGNATLRGSAVGFDLTLDAIDLDRYLPPAGEPAAKPAAPPPASAPAPSTAGRGESAAGAEADLLPVETLRKLDIDGVLNIGRLTVKKLLAEELKLTLKAREGQLKIGQQVNRFYQGGIKGETSLDVRGRTPRTSVDAAATGIQVGSLLKDLAGQDKLTGKGRFSASLTTQGNSIDAFKRTLGGKLDFRFEDGAVKGVNVAQAIREARARLSGKPLPASGQPAQTDFSELSGSGVITNGVLSNQDLLAKSPYLRVNGAGDINLVAENLDYTVEGVLVNTDKGQGGEGLDELKGVVIPVHLTGPLASPKFKINWEKILLESQKGKLKEKIQEKVQEKLEQKLKGGKIPGELQDALKGLFN